MSENVYARPYPTNNVYDRIRLSQPASRTQQDAGQRTTAQHAGKNMNMNIMTMFNTRMSEQVF